MLNKVLFYVDDFKNNDNGSIFLEESRRVRNITSYLFIVPSAVNFMR